MEIVKSIGALMFAIGMIYICNKAFNEVERDIHKTEHRRRIKMHTRYVLLQMRENDHTENTNKQKAPANKHRNTIFHSEECAAACGGQYIPKGDDL